MLTDTACKNAHKGDKAALGKAFKLSDDKAYTFTLSQGIKVGQSIGGLSIGLGVLKNCLPLESTPMLPLTKPGNGAKKPENNWPMV